MIRNEKEYRNTLDRIQDFTSQIMTMREQLQAQGFAEMDIAEAISPTKNLLEELAWDRDFYQQLQHEGVSAVPDYPPELRGKALIALRIACGWSQKTLADALKVSPAQVSRDETNDYHGITQERYARILQVLGVEEHVAGYRPKQAIIIQMPSIIRQAASFSPDYAHHFAITSHLQGV